MIQQRAWIRTAWNKVLGAGNKKRETMSDKEDCAGKIINEWLRQIIQAVTVGLFVLLLEHITHTHTRACINKEEEEKLGSSSKRNLIVIYHQTSPEICLEEMEYGTARAIERKQWKKREKKLADRGIITIMIVKLRLKRNGQLVVDPLKFHGFCPAEGVLEFTIIC